MKEDSWSVADICDLNQGEFDLLQNGFRSFGGINKCAGQVEPVRLDVGNQKLITCLEEEGDGRIAVVSSPYKTGAVLGDRLASIAIGNGWAGIVVDGALRDVDTLAEMPIAVFANSVCPVRGARGDEGFVGRDIVIDDVVIRRKSYIYADSDGLIVADKQLTTTVS